jgi:ABC-type transport system involved in Fe-S cluster assembly fused permease/ATPase subunit
MASASLKIGELQRQAIYSAIRDHRQLLVVISADSVLSRWVENEVERALAKENETKTPCILPIRIDEVALNTDTSWVVALRDTRNIADFTGWGNPILRATLQNDLLAALLAEE